MGKTKKVNAAEEPESSLVSSDPSVARPRLKTLTIQNFRCIGDTPVVVELDDIVVLVGPNNVGKTTILLAYEAVMSMASLQLDDFPNGVSTGDPAKYPTIELATVVYDNAPGVRWIAVGPEESVVRERWVWSVPGKPKRQGFDVLANDWSDQVPWGAPNVAQAGRPKPHRVDAFASPDVQATQLCELLLNVLKDRMKQPTKNDPEGKSRYERLVQTVEEFQKEILEDAEGQIKDIEDRISAIVGSVFPQYAVEFDAGADSEIEKSISPFKGKPSLAMGPAGGHKSSIDRQGSGARRTLLWAALKIAADSNAGDATSTRPNLLLIDEPEICLHPSAIREACATLYDLAKAANWQVVVTTHSPVFIDLSRDHTCVVRVERTSGGQIHGTTVFRPATAKLTENDKENLKLMNAFDPYVAEFFFGGRTIIVEGDTEYSVFKYVLLKSEQSDPKDIHIVRARGKATIRTLVKILNHFGAPYAVLHDSDTPTLTKKNGEVVASGAWTLNTSIAEVIAESPRASAIRHVVTVPSFEPAFFGRYSSTDKPYLALEQIQSSGDNFETCHALLRSLLYMEDPPSGAVVYSNADDLKAAFDRYEES